MYLSWYEARHLPLVSPADAHVLFKHSSLAVRNLVLTNPLGCPNDSIMYHKIIDACHSICLHTMNKLIFLKQYTSITLCMAAMTLYKNASERNIAGRFIPC